MKPKTISVFSIAWLSEVEFSFSDKLFSNQKKTFDTSGSGSFFVASLKVALFIQFCKNIKYKKTYSISAPPPARELLYPLHQPHRPPQHFPFVSASRFRKLNIFSREFECWGKIKANGKVKCISMVWVWRIRWWRTVKGCWGGMNGAVVRVHTAQSAVCASFRFVCTIFC